jgi:hypothetical protein
MNVIKSTDGGTIIKTDGGSLITNELQIIV